MCSPLSSLSRVSPNTFSAVVIAVYKITRLPALASEDFSYETSDLVVWTA